jgi:hypothetical protein
MALQSCHENREDGTHTKSMDFQRGVEEKVNKSPIVVYNHDMD